jgi:hypothetical protein
MIVLPHKFFRVLYQLIEKKGGLQNASDVLQYPNVVHIPLVKKRGHDDSVTISRNSQNQFCRRSVLIVVIVHASHCVMEDVLVQ